MLSLKINTFSIETSIEKQTSLKMWNQDYGYPENKCQHQFRTN